MMSTSGRGIWRTSKAGMVWTIAGAGTMLAALAVTAALLPGAPGGISRRTWILTASSAFVGLGGLSAVTVRGRTSLLMLVGLAHCWLGDALGPVNFTLGGLSFLGGHLWFMAGFAGQGVDRGRGQRAGAVLLVSGGLLGAWLLPRLGSTLDLALVLSYLTVISLMVAAAVGTRDGPWRYAGFAAGLFYVSDIVVADWRFVHSDLRHDLICYPLYYGACVLLALWPLVAQRSAAAAGPAAGGISTPVPIP